MEKLMELLQEYLNSEVFKKDISWNDNIEDIPDVKLIRYFTDIFYCTYISDTEFQILTDTVISKRYGFIKWLVENDKIDTNYWPWYWLHRVVRIENWEKDFYPLYETLLMLLSISDTPIDDLINYLK